MVWHLRCPLHHQLSSLHSYHSVRGTSSSCCPSNLKLLDDLRWEFQKEIVILLLNTKRVGNQIIVQHITEVFYSIELFIFYDNLTQVQVKTNVILMASKSKSQVILKAAVCSDCKYSRKLTQAGVSYLGYYSWSCL